MPIRVSARIACLAIVTAEATAIATRADEATLLFGIVFVVLQIVAVGWATDRRSAVTLRMVAPALLTAVAVAAMWTALALAVPVIAAGDTAALVAILAVAPCVAAASRRRGPTQRLVPLMLVASAGSALLIFLVISCLLPVVPGFVSTSHAPVYYTKVTRLVDPVRELAIFLLLAVTLGVDLLRARIRAGRAAAREQRLGHTAGLNEMVVERSV